jgi:hypothetical protein
VFRVALWVLGEYAVEPALLDLALNTIRGAVGTLPLLAPKYGRVPSPTSILIDLLFAARRTDDDEKKEDGKDGEQSGTAAAAPAKPSAPSPAKSTAPPAKKGPVVLADGELLSRCACTLVVAHACSALRLQARMPRAPAWRPKKVFALSFLALAYSALVAQKKLRTQRHLPKSPLCEARSCCSFCEATF